MSNKVKFSELRKIIVEQFGLRNNSLKGSREAKEVRCIFIRMAFIHCDGSFDDISEFLGQQMNSTGREIGQARELMKNPYYIKTTRLIETQIKWEFKH